MFFYNKFKKVKYKKNRCLLQWPVSTTQVSLCTQLSLWQISFVCFIYIYIYLLLLEWRREELMTLMEVMLFLWCHYSYMHAYSQKQSNNIEHLIDILNNWGGHCIIWFFHPIFHCDLKLICIMPPLSTTLHHSCGTLLDALSCSKERSSHC